MRASEVLSAYRTPFQQDAGDCVQRRSSRGVGLDWITGNGKGEPSSRVAEADKQRNGNGARARARGDAVFGFEPTSRSFFASAQLGRVPQRFPLRPRDGASMRTAAFPSFVYILYTPIYISTTLARLVSVRLCLVRSDDK